jgi:hypothetical protein
MRAFAILAAVVLAAGCGDAVPQQSENRGRVVDEETGAGIPGAIVVARYVGSRGLEGSSSCNRVESAVSDTDGWFVLPYDKAAGPLLMDAYHKDYMRGRPTRGAQNGVDGDYKKWHVVLFAFDDATGPGRVVGYEPKIYHSREEALEASRERKDVYLRRFRGSREERLLGLRGLSNAGSCGGPPQTSPGPIPFFEAIRDEQVQLKEEQRFVDLTNNDIKYAEDIAWRSNNRRQK